MVWPHYKMECKLSHMIPGLVNRAPKEKGLVSHCLQIPWVTSRTSGLLSEDGAGEDRVVASLPAKVHLARELVSAPYVRDLSLHHHCPQVEQLRQSQTPC